MPVKLDKDSAITKLKDKYPNFDFSKFEYVNQNTPSTVICLEHGEVLRTYKDCVRTGSACPKCVPNLKFSSEDFIKEIQEQCRDVFLSYNYKRVKYINALTPVLIGCKKHGFVELLPNTFRNLKLKSPCTKCNRDSIPVFDNSSFLKELKKIHGLKYSLHNCEWTDNYSKLELHCAVCDSVFKQTSAALLGGRRSGCQVCARNNTNNALKERIKPWPEMLERIRSIFGDKYSYDETSYQSLHKPIRIKCKEHGFFTQSLHNHLYNRTGCPVCGDIERRKNKSLTLEYIQEKSKEIHGDKYKILSKSNIGKSVIEADCKKHGLFIQSAQSHLTGHGCPKCGNGLSKGQLSLQEFIESLGVKTQYNLRLKSNKEIDVYCPELSIGFEYNGLRWHSEEMGISNHYHRDKTLAAQAEGIRLIHIFEDEWILPSKQMRTKNYIKTVLGKNPEKYNARQLKLDSCTWEEAAEFLEAHHMQGACAPTGYRFCLRLGEVIKAIMLFTESTQGEKSEAIELIRFCSSGIVRGGFSRLFKYSLQNLKAKHIVSFSNTRMSEGAIYEKFGFKMVDNIDPDYEYVKGLQRRHKRGFQHSRLKSMFDNYDSKLTEKENCKNNRWYRLWDCGKTKWILDLTTTNS